MERLSDTEAGCALSSRRKYIVEISGQVLEFDRDRGGRSERCGSRIGGGLGLWNRRYGGLP